MSQPNNNPHEQKLDKEIEILNEKLKNDPAFAKMVRSMLIDYVTNDLSFTLLAEKYHITTSLAKRIAIRFKFENRKKEYNKKLLDTVLGKAQKKQAEIIAKITLAVNEQVNRIIKKQASDPEYIISNNNMKDLIASLTIFNKEYRLDNNKMTESLGFNVRVEFPAHVPVITDNNKRLRNLDAEKEAEIVKEVVAEEKKQEEDVLTLNDDEPSESNKSFFGMVE